MSETVIYETEGAVARILMARPDKRNAESSRLIEERDAAFQRAESDPEVRVVVLGGNGPSFCAGHDLGEIASDSQMQEIRADFDSMVAFERRYYYEASLRIQQFSKPTIAMVQGACVAGGFVLAAMCDLIVAADDARFLDPVLGFGKGPGPEGDPLNAASMEVFFHPWQLGIRKAKELLFTGEWLTAEEAKAIGFVNRVVPRDDLRTATMTLAERVALGSPAAIAMVKRSFQVAQEAMGMRFALEHHFLLHQLRHAGLNEGWLRSTP